MSWPESRPVVAAEQPPSFAGSASARMREIEHDLEISQAQFAMALFQRDVAERRIRELEARIEKVAALARYHGILYEDKTELALAILEGRS